MLWLITLAVTTLEHRVIRYCQVFAYTREEAETEGLCLITGEFASENLVRVRTIEVETLEMAVL